MRTGKNSGNTPERNAADDELKKKFTFCGTFYRKLTSIYVKSGYVEKSLDIFQKMNDNENTGKKLCHFSEIVTNAP